MGGGGPAALYQPLDGVLRVQGVARPGKLASKMAIREEPLPSRKAPLALVLASAFGGLVVIALVVVLGLSLWVAARNTTELLTEKGSLILQLVTERIRDHLAPAQALVNSVGAQLERGELGLSDRTALGSALGYTLAAAPQVQGSVVISPEGWMLSVFRGADGQIANAIEDWQGKPHIRAAVVELMRSGDARPVWGPPLYIAETGSTILNFARPIYRDGRFVGAVVATIAVERLGAFLAELGTELNGRVFVLYGRDRVLAYPGMRAAELDLSPERPLPDREEIGDPVLAAIWSEGFEERSIRDDLSGHWERIRGRGVYYYLYRELSEDRRVPWLVGVYFRAQEVADQLRRLRTALGIAILAVLASLVAAIVLARRMARPIGRLADASMRVAALDLEALEPLPESSIREIDQAARAFNGMVAALRSFARYVPRELVRRLIRTGEGQCPESRELTVMFTDLAGFTALSETLDTAAVADLVERHFDMLGRCIEAEGGTVDKFMGDGVMAFWGAPGRVADHAERAVRAARAIAIRHLATGEDPTFLPLRIGIHTGEVIVGEIATRVRTSYTVLGDAVNTASRLQELVRELCPAAPVGILLSEATADRLEPGWPLQDLGSRRVRGRQHRLHIFRLEAG